MTDNDSDRWDELERLAREALDAAEAPCSTCGSDIGPGADAYIAAAHPQAILDLVGALRTAEGRVAACSRPIRDTVSAYEVMLEECEAMEAERDALRAEVERLRGAVKVRARCCDLADYGHRDGCPEAP